MNKPALIPRFEDIADGCEFSASCLTCPLPGCKNELSLPAMLRLKARFRQRAMLQVIEDEGLTDIEAAARFKVYVRTIERARAFIRNDDIPKIFMTELSGVAPNLQRRVLRDDEREGVLWNPSPHVPNTEELSLNGANL